jgi:hypothetical protein
MLVETRCPYEEDFLLWTQEQARVLREAAHAGINIPVDWENVAEEIEDLGRSIRFELRNRLSTILEHLLKLQHSPAVEPWAGWRSTIRRTRDDIEDLLNENPSLRQEVAGMIADAMLRAARRVADDLSERGEIDDTQYAAVETTSLSEDQVLSAWFPDPVRIPKA